VDLFELLCKVLDQNLFAQVDWARNSYYFKELKVGGRIQQHRDSERKKVSHVNTALKLKDTPPPPPGWEGG
jgi:hypothetical protein